MNILYENYAVEKNGNTLKCSRLYKVTLRIFVVCVLNVMCYTNVSSFEYFFYVVSKDFGVEFFLEATS